MEQRARQTVIIIDLWLHPIHNESSELGVISYYGPYSGLSRREYAKFLVTSIINCVCELCYDIEKCEHEALFNTQSYVINKQ